MINQCMFACMYICRVAPYQILLHDKRLIYAPQDTDQVIRLRSPAKPGDPPSPSFELPANDDGDDDDDEGKKPAPFHYAVKYLAQLFCFAFKKIIESADGYDDNAVEMEDNVEYVNNEGDELPALIDP